MELTEDWVALLNYIIQQQGLISVLDHCADHALGIAVKADTHDRYYTLRAVELHLRNAVYTLVQ